MVLNKIGQGVKIMDIKSVLSDTFIPVYTLHIGDLNDKWQVNSTIDIQKEENGNYKRYTIGYVVFEHPCTTCNHYPPDNSIIFYDINVEYNYTKVEPKWTTAVKTDKCNNRAKVLNESAIEITWQS